jgi:hypothetical protein
MSMKLAPAPSSVKIALEKVAIDVKTHGGAVESEEEGNDVTGGVTDEGRWDMIQLSLNLTQQYGYQAFATFHSLTPLFIA